MKVSELFRKYQVFLVLLLNIIAAGLLFIPQYFSFEPWPKEMYFDTEANYVATVINTIIGFVLAFACFLLVEKKNILLVVGFLMVLSFWFYVIVKFHMRIAGEPTAIVSTLFVISLLIMLTAVLISLYSILKKRPYHKIKELEEDYKSTSIRLKNTTGSQVAEIIQIFDKNNEIMENLLGELQIAPNQEAVDRSITRLKIFNNSQAHSMDMLLYKLNSFSSPKSKYRNKIEE